MKNILELVNINKLLHLLLAGKMGTGRKDYRDYIVKHDKIVNKLTQMAAEDCGCFAISKLATKLGMDQRTIRAHLKIIEMDRGGIFTDPDEKQFCTREGIIALAKRLGLGEMVGS